jgi:putative tricarboxylic transport membrane protein
LGLGIVAAGLVIGREAAGIKVIPLYAKVGPAAFLWLAAGLLVLCGLIVSFRGWQRPADVGNELRGPLIILAGLALSVFLMVPLGFVPTATAIFTLTAMGLGSRSLVRDALVGLVLSTAAFLVFAYGLGLRLPLGSLFT